MTKQKTSRSLLTHFPITKQDECADWILPLSVLPLPDSHWPPSTQPKFQKWKPKLLPKMKTLTTESKTRLHEAHFKAVNEKVDKICKMLAKLLQVDKAHYVKITNLLEQLFCYCGHLQMTDPHSLRSQTHSRSTPP